MGHLIPAGTGLKRYSQIEMVKNELNDHAFFDVTYHVANDSSLPLDHFYVTEEAHQLLRHLGLRHATGSAALLGF